MSVTLAVMGGAALLSGLVQAYNAEKARGAERARLDEIKRLYDKIKPPDYDFSIEDPPKLQAEALKLPEFSGERAMPKWDLSKLELKDLEVVEKFTPEIAPLVYEQNPQLIEKSAGMKQGLDAQKTALRRFMSIGEGDGFDPEYQQRVEMARKRAQSEAQSRGDSIQQDFARRGMGGSGMELAAKIGANANAMDRNAMMGLEAETQAYRNQLNALAQGAQIGGQIYGQEQGTQARNADIINAFNQRMSRRHQDWEQMRVDALNQADLRNIQEAQRIADHNTMQGNRADQMHRQRMDDLTRFNFEAGGRERDRMDDLARWQHTQKGLERNYQDAQKIMAAQWRQGNIDRSNDLRSRQFDDKRARAAGQAGIAQSLNRSDIQRAQDRNAAIQGVTNAGMAYAMQRDNQGFQRDMADKYYNSHQNPNRRQGRQYGYSPYGGGTMYS